MPTHIEQEPLIISILAQIAEEKNKSLEKIKRRLLIHKNHATNCRFWEILDELIPNHGYQYIGCCAECGSLELRVEPPPT
jgi:hypothetical protein